MRIHLISIGGAAMHNIALDLHHQGHIVTGSDDEIYEPSLSRLKEVNLCPNEWGWFPESITSDIEMVILGMHARVDNPELLRAQELGLKIVSYPEFVFLNSQSKTRVVVAGSHGKTTTTAMIIYVLNRLGRDFDYLIGAQLEGFDRMVKLTDAPIIIIEGDEYLSSAIDRVPKIHHYKPHIAVITGIAWDHINVFPTFENYKKQFEIFIDMVSPDGFIYYDGGDADLIEVVNKCSHTNKTPYFGLLYDEDKRVVFNEKKYPISVIGKHNLRNMDAAMKVCAALGIEESTFLTLISDFTGANKRLQLVSKSNSRSVYLDFAHAPSKVRATTNAFKEWFGQKKLLAVFELHTFSSLNKEFLKDYVHTLDAADIAIVYFNKHTLAMKKMPDLDPDLVKNSFDHKDIHIFTENQTLHAFVKQPIFQDYNILLMTSGNFNQMPLDF